MTKLTMPCLLAIISVFLAVPGCATAPPIFQPLQTCGGKLVTVANAERVGTDVAEIFEGNPAGEADLLAFAGTEGWPFVACLVAYYEQNGTAVQRAGAAKFKAGHVEARAGG